MARAFNTRLVPNKGSLYEIYLEGGGPTPDALKGMYTSQTDAVRAIDSFQANVRKTAAESTAANKRKAPASNAKADMVAA